MADEKPKKRTPRKKAEAESAEQHTGREGSSLRESPEGPVEPNPDWWKNEGGGKGEVH